MDWLVVCDLCKRSEWVLYRRPPVYNCYTCKKRMRKATASEKAEAEQVLKTDRGR